MKGAFRFARKHRIPIYATEGTFRALAARFGKAVDWLPLKPWTAVKLGRMTVESFPTPHDAVEPVGFVFRSGRLRFSHVTDFGHLSRSVEEALQGSQAILVESNHDVEMLRRGPYPDSLKLRVGGRFGHLSNEALGRYLDSRLPDVTEHIFLAHLSRTNNHEALALASCREALGRRGGRLPVVHLTYPDRLTPTLRLGEKGAERDERQGRLAF